MVEAHEPPAQELDMASDIVIKTSANTVSVRSSNDTRNECSVFRKVTHEEMYFNAVLGAIPSKILAACRSLLGEVEMLIHKFETD